MVVLYDFHPPNNAFLKIVFLIYSSETALTWLAIDFSEDEINGITEKLAVRFKLAETKDEFKKVFEESQEKLKNMPPTTAGVIYLVE